MIAPLSDGNAHGIDSSTEATVVKDEPRTGSKAGKGGSSPSPRPQVIQAGPGDTALISEASTDVKREDVKGGPATSTCTKSGSSHSRNQGPAGVGDGDEPSMPSAGATTGKGGQFRSPRPQGMARKMTGTSHCRCCGGCRRESPGRRGRRGKVTGTSYRCRRCRNSRGSRRGRCRRCRRGRRR